MPDFAPPPRRPAPDRLRNDIRSQLTAAPVRRVRLRTLVVPVAAASLVGVTIFGVSALGGRRAVAPVQTASPYPATATATPTPRPSARSSAPVTPQPTTATIDVRSMTKAEVRADTLSCRARTAGATDLPRRGTVQVQLAQVQRRAGIDGPLEQPSRTLILHDDAGVWVCENGDNTSWMAGRLTTRTPTTAVPAIEVPNYSDVSADCGSDARVHAKDLFAVGDQVRAGRVRLVIGDRRGPWQSSTPVDGLVHFLVGLTGPDIESRTVSMQYQFLGSDGQRLTIQPYGQRGTPTTSTLSKSVETCADARARLPRPEPIIRPTSDDTGIKTCLTMAKDAASTTVPVTVQWTARLVVSSKSEWGAVLSDGHHRVGCSLFPTREISPFSADSPEITRSSFFFAVNPTPAGTGESLWAAGRVPADVTGIDYRLPGNTLVHAVLDHGYWMVKYHRTDGGLAKGDRKGWDPVVVTVTRPGSKQTFTLGFTQQTSCHQISHGC